MNITGAERPPLSLGPFFESYSAVDFFVLLSGFVLAHAYEAQLRAGLRLGRFMTMRAIRLYPLYLLALALEFYLVANSLHPDAGIDTTQEFVVDCICAILFLPSPAALLLAPRPERVPQTGT